MGLRTQMLTIIHSLYGRLSGFKTTPLTDNSIGNTDRYYAEVLIQNNWKKIVSSEDLEIVKISLDTILTLWYHSSWYINCQGEYKLLGDVNYEIARIVDSRNAKVYRRTSG